MLDSTPRLVLRAVAEGDADESPALRSLVAAGLVEPDQDRGYAVTAAGRAALEASEPSRWERVAWPVAGICVAVLVIATVVDWFT